MNGTGDDLVDRVLQSLRDTEPLQGMESRIVDAVRHRASAILTPTRSPWRIASLAASALFAALICAVSIATHRKTPQAFAPHPQAISAQAADALVVPLVTAKRIASHPSVRKARSATALPPKEESADVSYPAPPMPLTEQEKLLLRIAHKGDPVQLAMLDPVQREAKYADERAQVQRFFTTSKQEITSEP